MILARVLVVTGLALSGFYAAATQPMKSDGDILASNAWASLNKVAPALKVKNVRLACRSFGNYEVYKQLALTNSTTNQWDKRNLRFNEDDVISQFCSETASTVNGVTVEEAIEAAERSSSNIGLESIQE
ncbi:MAG: hypothetical protein AB7N80_03870 [Bdellovibrionales bacterium]